jgi:hypothetical protein
MNPDTVATRMLKRAKHLRIAIQRRQALHEIFGKRYAYPGFPSNDSPQVMAA